MNEEREETQGIPLPGETDKVPEFLQGDQWFSAEIDDDLLDFDEPYRPPRYTMERGGVPFADVGELHLVSGKPGNGKTGLMSQLEATTLSGQFGGMTGRRVKHRIRDEQTGEVSEQEIPARLLHIDTEQGKDDTIAFKNRVCSMAGLSSDEAKQHFFILRLRETEKAVDRWRKILKAIWVVKPTDIFIDGLLDIVEDYNDQKECQPIFRKCMMLATEYDASLWAVLHENPMVDKLVGTLGSIAQRKVSEIFVLIKVKQSELKSSERRDDLPDIYFRVKQVKARGKDVEDWLFRYETNVGGWGQPVEIGESSSVPAPQTESDEAILKAVVCALLEFMRPPQSEYFTNIVKELKKRMHCGDTKAKTYFTMANDASVFSLPVNNRYSLNTSQCDAILNDLPFAPPKP
jgi:hypothetical protein